MSDDFSIPAPAGRAPISSGYRARRTGWQPEVRLLVIVAAVLGGLSLLAVGGWAMFARRPATVPVIEADSRPLRVKPENPGGMQLANGDEGALGDGRPGSERMAPPPESPAPQALRAQMQTAQPAPPPAPVSVAPPAAPLTASPLPDTPARPAAAPVAAPAARTATVAVGTMVQLAAMDSEALATAEWQRLLKRMPDLLTDRKPVVQKADRDGKTIFRVRTGGFADTADATGFCGKVKAKGGSCTLATF